MKKPDHPPLPYWKFPTFALFLLHRVVLSSYGGGGGYGGGCSQRVLCINPNTVMVVLLMGLWLLLGCDNDQTVVIVVLLLGLWLLLGCDNIYTSLRLINRSE